MASLVSDALLRDARAEADRAHRKHGRHSMFYSQTSHDRRSSILMEEVGEVARELNEAAYGILDTRKLRAELVQVAAMALTWAQAIDDHEESERQGNDA